MNRILFLPKNRHLLYYAKRAVFRGHLPKFEPVDLEDGWHMPDFDDQEKMERVYVPKFKRHVERWCGKLDRIKPDFLVVDRETNIEINAAVNAAYSRSIPTCYVMHGSDIFDLPEERDRLLRYDHLYLPNELNRRYFEEIREGSIYKPEIHKFNRWSVKAIKSLPEKKSKTIMYVPMFNHQSEHVERSGCLLSNDERAEYNRVFFRTFLMYWRHKFLWCHDPKLDREFNKTFHFLNTLRGTNVKWVKGDPRKQFKRADAIITDVGSTVFFEAIGTGKPVLCLCHEQHWPLKATVHQVFEDSFDVFHSEEQQVELLFNFLNDPTMFDYRPYFFLLDELANPNDPLVWEER